MVRLTEQETAQFRAALQEVLDFAGSTFVSATFIKRDGTRRQITFNARVGREGTPTAKRFRTGEGMAYDPVQRGLLPVVDIDRYKAGKERVWRNVNFNTLEELKVRGFTFKIDWDKLKVTRETV